MWATGWRPSSEPRAARILTQSSLTGLAHMLSHLSPSMLVWAGLDKDAVDANGIPDVIRVAFLLGGDAVAPDGGLVGRARARAAAHGRGARGAGD